MDIIEIMRKASWDHAERTKQAGPPAGGLTDEWWDEIVKDEQRCIVAALQAAGYSIVPSPVTSAASFAVELRKWWSFDDGQMHTHSWHSREDFIEKKLPELLRGGCG